MSEKRPANLTAPAPTDQHQRADRVLATEIRPPEDMGIGARDGIRKRGLKRLREQLKKSKPLWRHTNRSSYANTPEMDTQYSPRNLCRWHTYGQ